MYVCQWHLDTPFGRQAEAVRIMGAWGRDKIAHSEFRRADSLRLLAGHVGVSPSHLVDEYRFATVADFETALSGMSAPVFREHARALAPLIVPGSQRWEIYRVLGGAPEG